MTLKTLSPKELAYLAGIGLAMILIALLALPLMKWAMIAAGTLLIVYAGYKWTVAKKSPLSVGANPQAPPSPS